MNNPLPVAVESDITSAVAIEVHIRGKFGSAVKLNCSNIASHCTVHITVHGATKTTLILREQGNILIATAIGVAAIDCRTAGKQGMSLCGTAVILQRTEQRSGHRHTAAIDCAECHSSHQVETIRINCAATVGSHSETT